MALGSTQPLLGVFPGGKSGRCVRLTTSPPSWAIVTLSGNLNFLEPSGHLRPVMGLLYLLKVIIIIIIIMFNLGITLRAT